MKDGFDIFIGSLIIVLSILIYELGFSFGETLRIVIAKIWSLQN